MNIIDVKRKNAAVATGDRGPTPRAERYAAAERRMRRGRRVVYAGFAVTVVGVVGYCVACFQAAVHQDLGTALLENPGYLVGPTLGIIGLGTLLWIVGSFLFLSGAMDADPNGPELPL